MMAFKIDQKLQTDIREYFMLVNDTKYRQDELNEFMDMLSPSLQTKI